MASTRFLCCFFSSFSSFPVIPSLVPSPLPPPPNESLSLISLSSLLRASISLTCASSWPFAAVSSRCRWDSAVFFSSSIFPSSLTSDGFAISSNAKHSAFLASRAACDRASLRDKNFSCSLVSSIVLFILDIPRSKRAFSSFNWSCSSFRPTFSFVRLAHLEIASWDWRWAILSRPFTFPNSISTSASCCWHPERRTNFSIICFSLSPRLVSFC
mmetsp:Transcript_31912/g.77767  ORF Transcript_31912/g.77767 Transcript_31912/m.77767 type:complete len:214 (+) Transcript_31912:2192-2833(+)